MARFIALKLPGAQGQTIHVNVDQIRVLRPEVKEKTAIIFDDKHKVVIEGTADHILTPRLRDFNWRPANSIRRRAVGG